MLNVIFEDNHLLVVEKPVNILSQGDNTNDDDMVNLLKKYLKEMVKFGVVMLAHQRITLRGYLAFMFSDIPLMSLIKTYYQDLLVVMPQR